MPRALPLVVAATLCALPGCRQAARELEAGPSGREGPKALAEALAARFGPIRREPAWDALRPKLARAAFVPSRVFDDASAWTARGDGWRAVEFTGTLAGGAYHVGVRAEAPEPVAPGDYRGRLRLRRLPATGYEWQINEELGTGRLRPADLAAALTALARGAEATDEAGARAAMTDAFPRTAERISPLLRLDVLSLVRDPHGATAVRVAVRVTPAGLKPRAPHWAAFVEKYATPTRVRVVVADALGVVWWTLDGADNLWTVRVRVRDGSLVPLEGAADRRIPGHLRVTADYSTRVGIFAVGLRRLVADVTLVRLPLEKGFVARFLEEPDWRLPVLVEPLLHAPLRFPFEGPGSETGWAVVEGGEGRTRFVRHDRARVRESWVVRWLGGMASGAVDEFRAAAEREADAFNREVILALRDDVDAFAASLAGS
jgi:hypothetical protein